jgi:hypothetical protein
MHTPAVKVVGVATPRDLSDLVTAAVDTVTVVLVGSCVQHRPECQLGWNEPSWPSRAAISRRPMYSSEALS